MSSELSRAEARRAGSDNQQDVDDAEQGLYDGTRHLPMILPQALLDPRLPTPAESTLTLAAEARTLDGFTPTSSVTVLSLSKPAQRKPSGSEKAPEPAAKKVAPPKPKASRCILFSLWFNTYRMFFVFVTLLNLAGIILSILGRFPYAESHLGALVLGNLLCAIMVRNELFLRFLYLIAIYGLRSVRTSLLYLSPLAANERFISGPLCALRWQ